MDTSMAVTAVDARMGLIAILRLAYSGERAAGYAYRGHWQAARDPEEREHIHRIEDEEWHHRRQVGEMLQGLGACPSALREGRALVVGRVLGLLCHVSGWYAPMYAAGRLERRNVGEYEDAARLARSSGHDELVDCLLTMAEVEWDHEAYFRGKVEGHPLTRWVGLWEPLPPRSSIRETRPSLVEQGRAAPHALEPPLAPPA